METEGKRRVVRHWRWWVLAVAVVVALCFEPVRVRIRRLCRPRSTVREIVARHGAEAERVWRGRCAAAGVGYPPKDVTLVGLKRERLLEVWAAENGRVARLAVYPILAASGGPGPKRREGDRQVPEGVYDVAGLNPNSLYHRSVGIGYPNDRDLRDAAREGRAKLGGGIVIHGGAQSAGCLALGDAAAEELFLLMAMAEPERARVLLCPNDLRTGPPAVPAERMTEALRERYREVSAALPGDGFPASD